MVNLKRNSGTIKQKFASEKRTKTDSKLFFNASKDVKLLEVRNEISDEMVSFASTWAKLQKKTTHTSPLGKNDKTTKRDGHCV